MGLAEVCRYLHIGLLSSEWVDEWINGWGLTSPCIDTFSVSVISETNLSVNHLYWYWQPIKNNRRDRTQKMTPNNTTQKVVLVNSTIDTLKKSRPSETEDLRYSHFTTSGQETKRIYSFNPGARIWRTFVQNVHTHNIWLLVVAYTCTKQRDYRYI